MPLSTQQKQQIKDRFGEMTASGEFFSKGGVDDLYVIDADALKKAATVFGKLLGKMVKAAWTRGKQGHGR